MEQRLRGTRVAIIVTNNFEQVELTEPRRALDEAGAVTQIVAPKPGQVQGMDHDVKADTFPVDALLSDVTGDDFDAVMLPGGALNADALRVVPEAQDLLRRMDRAGKPIAAICH